MTPSRLPEPDSAASTDAGGSAAAWTLTAGLGRNTLWNFLGWVFTVVLGLVTVPIFVDLLGITRYGVWSIVSMVAGYLGVLHTPAAQGGVRFMADAWARRHWTDLWASAGASVALSALLSAGGAAAMAATAPLIAAAFDVPADLRAEAIRVLRLASLAFLFNGTASSLAGVLSATRRFDLLNQVGALTRALTAGSVVVALLAGYGLGGAVLAQALSALASMMVHGLTATHVLRGAPRGRRTPSDRGRMRQLLSFSGALFGGNLAATFGLQLDRTVTGVYLGPVAVGYYNIPGRLTDTVVGAIGSLTDSLYPLSSEAVAAGRVDEIRDLYLRAARLLAWTSALLSVLIIAPAHELLRLWVGPAVAERSWGVLVILATTFLPRGPCSLAYRVGNGMGRADAGMWLAWSMFAAILGFVLLLTPRFGLEGAALGAVLGVAPASMAYDLWVLRRLLAHRDWAGWLGTYAKPALAALLACWAASFVPAMSADALGLVLKAAAGVAVFGALARVLEPVLAREALRLLARASGRAGAGAGRAG
jgi:O-antigen/teichoic acid export membrane protein